jgi:hypothetical protein
MFTKLTHIDVSATDDHYRLCLDRFSSPDNPSLTHALVWRGNSRSRDGFQRRPAAFTMEQLGRLVGAALDGGHLSSTDLAGFIEGLRSVRAAD